MPRIGLTMGSTPRGISGSRIAAILAFTEPDGTLSAYQTPFEVAQMLKEECHPGYAAAHGQILPPPVDNAAVRWGSAFEDAVLSLSEQSRGQKITDRERQYVRDYLTCHIDGLYADGSLYEGKSTTIYSFHDSWGEPGTDRVPQSYQCQAQWNMELSGCESCNLSVLVFPRRQDDWEKEGILASLGTGTLHKSGPVIGYIKNWASVLAEMGFFHIYHIERNRDAAKLMQEAAAHFWEHYVVGNETPDLRTYDDCRRAFPAPVGTIIVSDDEERWIVERKAITEEIGASGRLGKRKEELKILTLKSICARIGRDAVLDTESQEKVVFRSAKGDKLGSFDGKTFR